MKNKLFKVARYAVLAAIFCSVTLIAGQNGRSAETKAQELYEKALTQKNLDFKSNESLNYIASSCIRILKYYPDTSQAQNAKNLLRQVPRRFYKKYKIADAGLELKYPNRRPVKRSKRLRRRFRRRYELMHDYPIEDMNMPEVRRFRF